MDPGSSIQSVLPPPRPQGVYGWWGANCLPPAAKQLLVLVAPHKWLNSNHTNFIAVHSCCAVPLPPPCRTTARGQGSIRRVYKFGGVSLAGPPILFNASNATKDQPKHLCENAPTKRTCAQPELKNVGQGDTLLGFFERPPRIHFSL